MNKIQITNFLLFFFLSVLSYGQVQLPLSRTDSATIVENDSIHKYFLSIDNKKEASRHLDLNADIYWKHNYFDSAISYYERSLELNNQLGNLNGIAGINSNLALIYADKKSYKKAYDFFEKTLAVRKSNNEKIGIISALINESVVLNKLEKYTVSIEKLEEALSIAQEMSDERQMRSVFGMLSETYQKMGNAEKAMYYYEFYKSFNEYVTDKKVKKVNKELELEKMQKSILELEAEKKQLELEKQNFLVKKQKRTISNISNEQKILMDSLSKQEMSLKLINQESKIQKLENQALKIKKKRQAIIITFVMLLVVVLLGLLTWVFLLFRAKSRYSKDLNIKNEFISQQKEEIEVQRNNLVKINSLLNYKNEQIINSINYAKRIQEAIFMSSERLDNMFKDSFLFYLPLDIISGDFYYFKQINQSQSVVVVGDCTGHGVPGAFLTIMGTNILNNIIHDKKIYKPSNVLLELDKRFFYMLNKGEEDIQDGMDVAVCLVDKKNKTIEFAGAKNSLLIVQDKNSEIIRGTKDSIGHTKESEIKNLKYENHKIEITQNTWFYMFSDGIIDQFNGDTGKKYLRKRLIEKLSSNTHKKGIDQKKEIEKDFYSWKKNTEQTDDIILLGFSPEI